MAAGLDLVVTGAALATCLSPVFALRERTTALVPETGSHPAGKVWCAKSSASCELERIPSEELQEILWKQFFADPSQWWDIRRKKTTPQHPDFRHKKSKIALWLRNRQKPGWVDAQLARWDAGRKKASESVSASVSRQGAVAAHEGHLEVRMCRKLCEDGRISEAVDALSPAVQRGCHVEKNLFYRLLKWCISHKDLTLGRRIHALSVKSGYEGDAFLATHIIGLYASYGRLEEAMRVFAKVSTPDSYNWATIIFAYARNGKAAEAAEAIRLYRQMREAATVEPDGRIHSAVLKACAVAGDLVAGKEVHAHILASPSKPDRFVEAGLVDMYAKCGSLEDARRVFDKLPERTVVAWNAMLAGYAQQGMGQEALDFYRGMLQEDGSPPSRVTYVCLLQACASVGVGALLQGKQLHSEIREKGLQGDVVLCGSLINMYAKCGSLEDARSLFDIFPARNVVTWTAMISGYAQQGMGQEALALYRSMQREGHSPPDSVTYACLLRACATVGALHEGKQLHAEIKERGLQEDAVLGGTLVNMYAKCGRLEDARSVFDILPARDVFTWTAMIAGYAKDGMGAKALGLYRSMQQEGLSPPDLVTFVCLLQACATIGAGALHEGKQLHTQIEERGLQDDAVLGGSLVNMYAKCGSLEDACRVFERLPERTVVAWNAMLAGYTQQGMGEEALALYRSMEKEDLGSPSCVTYVCLLQACASLGGEALPQGKQLHAEIQEKGLQDDIVLACSVINMYAKCGSLEDARRVFDMVPTRNVVIWTAIIAGYAQGGMGQEALSLYRSMQQEGLNHPDSVTYVCLLQACANVGAQALPQGQQLHAEIEEKGLQDGVLLACSLVNMYAKCGSLEDARRLFDILPHRNVVIWTAMIAGYAQQGLGQEALNLYRSMQQEGLSPPDSVTYVCLLQACASAGVEALPQGQQLHAEVEEKGLQGDVVLACSLVNMYAKCGNLNDARRMFDRLPAKNVESWNAILAGYAQQGMGEEALGLYRMMEQDALSPPDSVTYVCLLQACASVGVRALDEGKKLHSQLKERGLQEDVVLGGSLVNMYSKCGSLEDARRVFDRLAARNVVAWNAILGGYIQQGMGQEALSVYRSMQQEGLSFPDSVTFKCMLQACALVAALPLGKELHAQIQERGLQADPSVGAAVVNMYAKCGSMLDSQQVFDALHERTMEAWNSLIGGYTRQGDSQVVFDLVDRMRLEGIHPNEITYLSVLTVCSHVGLVDKGREYFEAMTDYGISATLEHFACMIDLLGRAGHLEDALQMAKTMPFPPTDIVWHTLLGACRKWKNVEVGRQVFEGAMTVDEQDAASYVLMSNIYASAKMWEAAREMQAKRKKLGAWKKPGQSWWTDMGGVVHMFVVGDKKHPESEGIYARMDQLIPKMKKEGYVPHLHSSLRDISDDEKEAELCGHSEKLAIAYALNKTPEGTTIRIVKNLRVCTDCHTATAYIAQVEKRTIICRDASRFHIFKEGKCSCGDYW